MVRTLTWANKSGNEHKYADDTLLCRRGDGWWWCLCIQLENGFLAGVVHLIPDWSVRVRKWLLNDTVYNSTRQLLEYNYASYTREAHTMLSLSPSDKPVSIIIIVSYIVCTFANVLNIPLRNVAGSLPNYID